MALPFPYLPSLPSLIPCLTFVFLHPACLCCRELKDNWGLETLVAVSVEGPAAQEDGVIIQPLHTPLLAVYALVLSLFLPSHSRPSLASLSHPPLPGPSLLRSGSRGCPP